MWRKGTDRCKRTAKYHVALEMGDMETNENDQQDRTYHKWEPGKSLALFEIKKSYNWMISHILRW